MIACALVACGGDDGAGGRGDDSGDDDAGGGADGHVMNATGTRNGVPFTFSKPCFGRLDTNNAKFDSWDADQGLGFQVRWDASAAATTYPNDNSDPEVIVSLKQLEGGRDTNYGTQQGTVTFETLGQEPGTEAVGHFDGVVIDFVELDVTASATFRCLLN